MIAAVSFTVIILIALALGLYVAVAMGLGGMAYASLFSDRSLWDAIGHITWRSSTSIELMALPLFVLMGEILLRGGLSEGMYYTLARWLNRLSGGLLHTNVAACAVFATVSGSSAATCATIGGVALPYMKKAGYNDRATLGSIAASGTLGILIPPSIAFVVYGVLTEVSIGRLYAAALLPGLLMTLSFMIVIFIWAKLRPDIAPLLPSSTWYEKFSGLVQLVPIFALVFLVLGTIYLGVATATEAAAFGVTGAFVIALLKGRVNGTMLRETLMVSSSTTALILFIMIGAFLLQFVMAFLGLPELLGRWVVEQGFTAVELVIALCIVYLILGTFLEELSVMVATIPILLPVLRALHVDLIWFGVIKVMLIQIAIISPPIGMNFFVVQSIRIRMAGKKNPGSLSDIYMGSIPFLLAMIVDLILIVLFPQISLWLVTHGSAL